MKKKYNHNAKDFIEALGLDKDEIIDIIQIGCQMHFIEDKSLSACIVAMQSKLKKDDPERELKMFCLGMIFSQALADVRDRKIDPFFKSNQKGVLPFTTKDLMKSVRDEIEAKEGKKTDKTDKK